MIYLRTMTAWLSKHFDFSAIGRSRILLLTAAGTLLCIVFSLTFDSYSFEEGRWRWGGNPANNVIIPLIIAPPFFFYMLGKLRQLAIAHQQLLVFASTDSLTMCLNRAAFTTLVDAYLEHIDQQDRRFEGALLVFDVDHFKVVNDSFGHEAGDEALKLIVQSIRSSLRDVDLVGRMGGEEFGVFLPGIAPERAHFVAERVRETVMSANFCPGGVPCDLSISVGGVTFVRDTTFSELYSLADKLLYDAKRNGRNRVELGHIRTNNPPAAVH